MSRFSDENGGVQLLFLAIAMLAVLLGELAFFSQLHAGLQIARRRQTVRTVDARTAIETFAVAIRHAELRYMIAVRGCETANVMMRALEAGHGCAGVGGIALFDGQELDGLSVTETASFAWLGPWDITEAVATTPADKAIVELRIHPKFRVRISFYQSFPERNRADFLATAISVDGGQALWRERFGLMMSDASTQVLTRYADNVIVVQSPIHGDRCRNQSGLPYLLPFGALCTAPGTVGAGDGLISYRGAIFAFRNWTGEIIGVSPPEIAGVALDETGIDPSNPGRRLFPAYLRSLLINYDDFEIVGEDSGADEIVGVTGWGMRSWVSVASTARNERVPLCNLGAIGLGASMSGFSRMRGNQSLLSAPSSGVASFLLKSDIGLLYYLTIKSVPISLAGSYPPDHVQTDAVSNKAFVCAAIPYRVDSRDDIWRTTAGMTSLDLENMTYAIF